jgi:hypothetical protein
LTTIKVNRWPLVFFFSLWTWWTMAKKERKRGRDHVKWTCNWPRNEDYSIDTQGFCCVN